MKYRFSATQLESYRRFLAGSKTAADLIETITGEFPGTAKTRAGEEFERAAFSGLKSPQFDNAHLTFSPVIIAYAQKQVKRQQEFAGVQLVGIVDALLGTEIIELKTTYSAVNIENYYASLQHHAYSVLFPECTAIQYVIAGIKGLSESEQSKELEVKSLHTVKFWTNPAQSAEYLAQFVYGLCDFVEIMGLQDHPKFAIK